MNREQVITKLRANERQLKQAGIVRLSLFGSTARGDAGPDSDVDLLAAFDATRRISLLDVVHIQNEIADLLGCRVELAEEGTLKPRVQKSASCLLTTRHGAFKTFSCSPWADIRQSPAVKDQRASHATKSAPIVLVLKQISRPRGGFNNHSILFQQIFYAAAQLLLFFAFHLTFHGEPGAFGKLGYFGVE